MHEDVAPNIRLKAATEWLDRAGHGKTVHVDYTDRTPETSDMTDEELMEKAQSLQSKLAKMNVIGHGSKVIPISTSEPIESTSEVIYE